MVFPSFSIVPPQFFSAMSQLSVLSVVPSKSSKNTSSVTALPDVSGIIVNASAVATVTDAIFRAVLNKKIPLFI